MWETRYANTRHLGQREGDKATPAVRRARHRSYRHVQGLPGIHGGDRTVMHFNTVPPVRRNATVIAVQACVLVVYVLLVCYFMWPFMAKAWLVG